MSDEDARLVAECALDAVVVESLTDVGVDRGERIVEEIDVSLNVRR